MKQMEVMCRTGSGSPSCMRTSNLSAKSRASSAQSVKISVSSSNAYIRVAVKMLTIRGYQGHCLRPPQYGSIHPKTAPMVLFQGRKAEQAGASIGFAYDPPWTGRACQGGEGCREGPASECMGWGLPGMTTLMLCAILGPTGCYGRHIGRLGRVLCSVIAPCACTTGYLGTKFNFNMTD